MSVGSSEMIFAEEKIAVGAAGECNQIRYLLIEKEIIS